MYIFKNSKKYKEKIFIKPKVYLMKKEIKALNKLFINFIWKVPFLSYFKELDKNKKIQEKSKTSNINL